MHEHIPQGLYDPRFEHDACGIGFVANLKGKKDHQTVSDALTILENMEHRGASGCEKNTGDGAGILIQIPHQFLFEEALRMGFALPEPGCYGVGVLFLSKDPVRKAEYRDAFDRCAKTLGLPVLGYRPVPVNRTEIGASALSVEPDMEQVFIACPDHLEPGDPFERKLFVLRNYASHTIRTSVKQDETGFYMASLSSRTLVYKGQLTSRQVRSYFPDLQEPILVSAFGLVHSRFATNTFPSWRLAQPFRYIAHNGEINTLQGNLNWLHASESCFASPYFSPEDLRRILPLIPGQQSDSACLDNLIELLTLSGRSLPHVLMMLIPEAWDGNDHMDADRKAFYEYHASMMEPWDGPASLSFTDGIRIGATLDRNGLRPSRYTITHDDRVIMASESGVLPVDPANIREKGRLQPGKMFMVDLEKGRIISDEELKQEICTQKPYRDWLNQYKIRLEELEEPRVAFTHLSDSSVDRYHKAFGYSREDLDAILKPMALEGKEPVGSMGSDIPLAVLSDQPQHLSSYFKQGFAQVTNPPIDPIRERMVMSLSTFLGNIGNLLDESPAHCHTVALAHPILDSYELEKLRSIDTGRFQSKTLHTYFRADYQSGSLERGLDRLCRYAEDAVRDGFQVLILCDRGVDSGHAAIPSLLATSAVHHHLIRKGLRSQVSLVVEAGDVWEVHHFACLIAFGATAINPYLALATIRNLKTSGKLDTGLEWPALRKNYIKAVCDGLLKVFSKMGISTLQSYHGAQIMEIVGLNGNVVQTHFTGAISRIGGMTLDDLAREALAKHELAFLSPNQPGRSLPVGGVYQWKRQGEFHLFNPTSIHLLQVSTRTRDYDLFKKYARTINQQEEKACTLRSLLEIKPTRDPIPLSEVEPADAILPRFATGAMSFGSISWEAHTTLAMAMNRLGGKSNTGEGGEDERRYLPLPNGDSMQSAIKQVASGRFGVTSQYLAEAKEIQIKMAQGAKPGEGGQLPGHKVDEWIGKTRLSTPGVGLISPPPHHDIYSIEDLAQLIFDLKNANRKARINVKLVSRSGVGTIAAGVAKAKADVVLISGHDGGTGASPISSIRHAGMPWELGLAETHQTLVRNKLRSRIVVQTDGQLKTARDIAVATLLGAEEWGIATAALVVEGCILMRKCHLNTCPVGVATQDEELRKRFTGEVDHVVTFFEFLVAELREIMASLGYRTINEMVGQVQNLRMREGIRHWKWKSLDLSALLFKPESGPDQTLFASEAQDHELDHILDWALKKEAQGVLEKGGTRKSQWPVYNTNRTVGTLVSYEITRARGKEGLPENSLHFQFKGTAGQSFGAFATRGLLMEMEGDANDYFGKGLSGATLAIYPSPEASFRPEDNSIIGNVAFYGATSGKAFIRGKAGERFAVRNSGASLVVESVGDHGCEYMTRGLVVVLGKVGRNFAAGMSGGLAFIYQPAGDFASNCNRESVDLDPPDPEDQPMLYALLQEHVERTGSTVARFILDDFENQCGHFVKVFPREYKKVLQQASLKTTSSIN